MSLLDKLKGLFSIDIFSKLQGIFTTNIVNNTYNDKVTIDNSSKTIIINVGKINPEEKSTLNSIIQEAITENNLLLEDKSKHLLDDFNNTEPTFKDSLVLLSKIIPNNDIPIWRASLYLKKCFEKGENIEKLKCDIVQKYGERGRSITNLCTANYLDKLILRLYEELKLEIKDENIIKQRFTFIYNDIISNLPITIFVSHYDKPDKLKDRITNKLINNFKYGIQILNIHGIGKSNIKKIEKIINDIENQYHMNKSVNIEENIIIAKINLLSIENKMNK